MMSVFKGKLLIIGFGSIGQAILPLLQDPVLCKPKKINIIAADQDGDQVAHHYGLEIEQNLDHDDPWQFQNFLVAY